ILATFIPWVPSVMAQPSSTSSTSAGSRASAPRRASAVGTPGLSAGRAAAPDPPPPPRGGAGPPPPPQRLGDGHPGHVVGPARPQAPPGRPADRGPGPGDDHGFLHTRSLPHVPDGLLHAVPGPSGGQRRPPNPPLGLCHRGSDPFSF